MTIQNYLAQESAHEPNLLNESISFFSFYYNNLIYFWVGDKRKKNFWLPGMFFLSVYKPNQNEQSSVLTWLRSEPKKFFPDSWAQSALYRKRQKFQKICYESLIILNKNVCSHLATFPILSVWNRPLKLQHQIENCGKCSFVLFYKVNAFITWSV